MYTTETTAQIEENCPGCFGSKVQTNKDGLRVMCPVCLGTGKLKKIFSF